MSLAKAPGASLSGGTHAAAADGMATFDTVVISAAGKNCGLLTEATGLAGATGTPMDVWSDVPSALEQLTFGGPGPSVSGPTTIKVSSAISGFSSPLGRPGALAVDTSGSLFIGQLPKTKAARPVVKISKQNMVTHTSPIPQPSGLAVDGHGDLYVSGLDNVYGPLADIDEAPYAI